jgi:hypothetical protein
MGRSSDIFPLISASSISQPQQPFSSVFEFDVVHFLAILLAHPDHFLKMEALAIFGGITAGVTLSAEIIRLSRSLREMIKSIKYARDDINKVAEEMFIFAEQLGQFLRTCSDSPLSTPFVSFSPESLVSWTKGATRGLKRLLREVKALTSDVRYDYSIVERVTAHVKWYFSKGSMKRFRASLRVARESMNGFTNIRVIEKLNEQLIFLKQAIREGNRTKIEAELGMTVEKSIENLELAMLVISRYA